MAKKIHISFILMALVMCLLFAGCNHLQQNVEPPSDSTFEDSETENEIIYSTVTIEKELKFVSAEEKEKWREPLLKLISNEGNIVKDEKGNIIGYDCPDLTQPSIERGVSFALIDFDIDGIPELAVENEVVADNGEKSISIYELYTGDRIGLLDGCGDRKWCTYFNTENGRFQMICHRNISKGSSGQRRVIEKFSTAITRYGYLEVEYPVKSIDTDTYLSADYDSFGWQQTEGKLYDCIKSDNAVDFLEYLYEYDNFNKTCIRIPKTSVVFVDKDSMTAEEIVDTLLSSEQKFCEGQQETMKKQSIEQSSQEPIVEFVYKYNLIRDDIVFADDATKETWREPLVKLIANQGYTVRNIDGDIIGYECPDPSQPSIESGYGYGLLDIDIDGTPELIIQELGGSGGSSYSVYDIYTGERLCTINGGGASWCVYLNTESGELEMIGQYIWHHGYSHPNLYIEKAEKVFDESSSKHKMTTSRYLSASYSGSNSADTRAYCFNFKINENDTTISEYFNEYDRFMETHIRIAETGKIDFDANYSKTPEEIVDMLLSSEQKFIIP